ncbi:MAG: glycosyltransferase family 4 protein [Chlamydiota bacterium]
MPDAAVHQIVAGFVEGDAISNYALALQAIFRAWGHESEIFCPLRHISPRMRGRARDLAAHRARAKPGDLMLFHFSIGSETVDYFRGLPAPRVLVYHNITPGRYFHALYDDRELLLDQGRRELALLAGVPDLSLADSSFNAAELKEAGFKRVEVMPIILGAELSGVKPDESVVRRLHDGKKNILFVGRIVPNKRYEDLLRCFHACRRFVGAEARLLLVGSYMGLERYLAFLKNMARELRLDDVLFTNHVRQDQLAAYYRAADLFLCMSEHEGFCIPLLEAMAAGVPVLAYAAGAVPETLGGSGVMVREKDYPRIAEMMAALLADGPLRAGVIARQRERLAAFDPAALERRLRGYLSPWL